MKRLADICDIQYGYAFDSKCFTEDSSYPQLVRIRDVKRGYSETYYSGNYPEEYILSEGDLLIGMDGEFNIARWKCSGALLNQRVCKLTTKVGTNEEYLRFAMLKSLKEIRLYGWCNYARAVLGVGKIQVSNPSDCFLYRYSIAMPGI